MPRGVFRRAFAGIARTPTMASNVFRRSAFGFRSAGHYQRVGWKLGAWHDVEWWQLDLLDDEVDPRDWDRYLSSADDRPSRRRATTSCWICWVPSKMSRIFESRAHFSSSVCSE